MTDPVPAPAARPELSVIMVVGERRGRAERALRSVLEQDEADRLEVLLVDLAPEGSPAMAGIEHPAVRILRPPPGTNFGPARVLAVRAAASPVVAFLEEHCRVQPGWARALVAAHRQPWAGVGAEVHTGNPRTRASRAISLMNYHPWLAPARRGEYEMLPGHNSSFKRDVLLGYGDELEGLLGAEVVLFGRLRGDGHRLFLEPDARFEHFNETGAASIARGYFLWHRCYGPQRAAVFHWSKARRWLYIVAAPLIPLYFIGRLAMVLARDRPELLLQAFFAAPVIVAAQVPSALGQAVGLLLGPGDALERFTWFEMNEPRGDD